MRYKLAMLDTHPVQYRAPLYKKIADHPDIDLTVYYCSDFGLKEYKDSGFGTNLKWDVPLLEGYEHKFLKNYSPRPSLRFSGLINPGIYRELKKENYHAIIVHGYTIITNWISFFSALITKTPVIFQGETVLKKDDLFKRTCKKIIYGILTKISHAILYIGTKSKEFYDYYNVDREKLFFTPYSVNNDFFIEQTDYWESNKDKIKGELNLPKELPIILYASKLISRKRPFDLLKAFKDLDNQAILIFVGDGEESQRMEEYVYNENIKNVFFLGFKNQSLLPKYYALADIFVLPSSFETWGLAINEAMCFSLPVITTYQTASSHDLIRHGENGFVYSAGDIGNLTKYLNILLENPEKRDKMGEKSLEIISTWNYDAYIDGMIEALNYMEGENEH